VGHVLARQSLGEQGAGPRLGIGGLLAWRRPPRPRDDDRDLAAGRRLRVVTRELPEGAGAGLFEHLGELACHGRAALGAARVGEIGQQLRDAGRRFEQHGGPLAPRDAVEQAAPLAPFARHEAEEQVAVGGQARDGEGGRHRGGPGDRHDGHIAPARRRDEVGAGIAHRRRARVGDERDVFPRAEEVENPAPRGLTRVRVKAHQLGARADVGEQDLGVACVFGRHHRHAAEGGRGPGREVVEVAERRRDDVQSARHVTTPPATAAGRKNPRTGARSGAPSSLP